MKERMSPMIQLFQTKIRAPPSKLHFNLPGILPYSMNIDSKYITPSSQGLERKV